MERLKNLLMVAVVATGLLQGADKVFSMTFSNEHLSAMWGAMFAWSTVRVYLMFHKEEVTVKKRLDERHGRTPR